MTTKTKRMKKVFSSHSEVAHIWAQQTHEEGRASRMFFEGDSIYSYGHHFKIARFVKNDIGQDAVLFNSASYSNSTAKHQNFVRRALNGKIVFTVPSLGHYGKPNHEENIRFYVGAINEYLERSVRARLHGEHYLNMAEHDGRALIKYVEFFGEDAKKYVTTDISVLMDRVRSNELLTDQQRIDIDERQKKQRQAAIEKSKEEIAEWLAGERLYLTSKVSKIFLRRHDDEVQTSLGAKVPASEARLLYHAIKKGIDVTGRKIGYYTVDSYDGNNLKVGCHTLDKAEIDRFAKTQKWD